MNTYQVAKYHGAQNDFILIDNRNGVLSPSALPKAATAWCHRHTGIGADGLITVETASAPGADLKMRIINADGSEPEMCGNGIRCYAKFVQDEGIFTNDSMKIETLAGVLTITVESKTEYESQIRVAMGQPILGRKHIPLAGDSEDHVLNEPIQVAGGEFKMSAVSMGNPHAVIFVDDLRDIQLNELGPQFAVHPEFPKGINTEFVEVQSPNEATMVVWERGAGATMACGTGACAIGVAGVLAGRLNRNVTIHLPGGDLKIEWPNDQSDVFMTGPAAFICTAEIVLS